MKRYDLKLTAATFLIVDHSKASDEIACEWQRCMKVTKNQRRNAVTPCTTYFYPINVRSVEYYT